MERRQLHVALASAMVATLTACSGGGGTGPKIGFLLSDYTSSSRWQKDRDDYVAAMGKLVPGAQIIVQDAKADQTLQQQQAESDLTQGAKLLVVVPQDAIQAKAIVEAAHRQQPPVPVLSYDRIVRDAPLDGYVTFDNFSVGVTQAKYLAAHVRRGGTIIELAGSPSDNNALEFHRGAMSVLQPLIATSRLKIGYSKFTPNWDSVAGQQEAASALSLLNNRVDGVLAANDALAGGAIAALKAQHLAGKVVVTGQDATVAGLQNILLGTQSMTVYKPIAELANAAAQASANFLRGKKFVAKRSQDNGSIAVPTQYFPVIAVTKDNIATTVLADGFVTKAQLCSELPPAACAKL